MTARRRLGGFTLVEILIAVAIGLFLTAGLIQVYLANKQTYRFNEALARIQENGRFALQRIAADLRMAGFFGCKGDSSATSRVDATSPDFNPSLHDFITTPALEGEDSPSGVAGDPDAFTLRGGAGSNLFVLGHGGAGRESDPIIVKGSITRVRELIGDIANRVADIVLVSDCLAGDIFQVTSLAANSSDSSLLGFSGPGASRTPGNVAGLALSKVYGRGALLYPLRVVRYQVPPGTEGLYRAENDATIGDELIEGVENLQLTYGEDTDGDGSANRYVSASAVTDWGLVVSARVGLLLHSMEGGLTSDPPQGFDVNGVADSCPSGKICQLLSTTVTLRNRAR